MTLSASRDHEVRVPIRGNRSRSLAVRAAAEAFVYLMHRCQVRQHELAAECWIEAAGRPVAGGTSREIVRRYRLAPPFWALTVNPDEAAPTGFGVSAHAVLIRYAQRPFPVNGDADGFTSVRTVFAPGFRDRLGRCGHSTPMFICEAVPPNEAAAVVKAFLIDAAMSQGEGRGPLITTGLRTAHAVAS